ncbi:MAG: thiol-disulfide isomerase/thioredoxin [Glaciecola sp.]
MWVEPAKGQKAGGLVSAVLPADAPKDLAKAFHAARTPGQPIVIDFWDFWVPWRGPCVRLNKETLHDPKVVKALEGAQVLYVNIDEHPRRAMTYGVKSIPNLFYIHTEGHIVERLKSWLGVPSNAYLDALGIK